MLYVVVTLKRLRMTPAITGWPWCFQHTKDTGTSEKKATSTPVSRRSGTSNALGLSSANSASLKTTYISRLTSQSDTPFKMPRSYSSLIVQGRCLRHIQVFASGTPMVGSGVDMSTMNPPVWQTSKNLLLTCRTSNDTTIWRSLMTDNSVWPPSEIRQCPIGLAEERRRNGIIRAEPLCHWRTIYMHFPEIYCNI